MKVLSDEEYAKVLREKALKVDVEIALVDEEMAKLEAKAEAEKHVGGREGKEP